MDGILYVGIDAHKRFCQATVMNKGGEIMEKKKFLTTKEELEEFVRGRKDIVAVVEASTSGMVVYDWLDEIGVNTKMAHPLKVKAIASAKIKTDDIDSRILADLLRGNLIPEAYVPPIEIRDVRGLVRHRTALVAVRTSIKNKIHAILAIEGINLGFSDLFGRAGRELLKTVKLREYNRVAVDNFLEVLDLLEKKIIEVSKRVDEEAGKRDNKDVEKLMEKFPGLGRYTALLIVTEIGDIKRFSNHKKLCSYAGLAPSTYSSGGITRHGRITKQGNKLLRWALIQAAWRVMKRDDKLGSFYLKLAEKKPKSVAVTAVAAKLLKYIYFTLMEINGNTRVFHGQDVN